MSETFWTDAWWWWLAQVLFGWVVLEVASLVTAHWKGTRHIQDWTLSDTIRRWSQAHRWLGPIIVGTMAMLLFHFFGQTNPS